MHRSATGLARVVVAAAAVAVVAAPGLAVPWLAARAEPAEPAAPPPTPRADCGPGSRPEPDAQGRAPLSEFETGSAQQGYWCNLEEVAHFGRTGGYKVHRYVDRAGRECAYYDSTLLFPGSLANTTDLTGVYVLDMADPASPQKTANLLTPAMQSPHESLELNQRRGLLVAGMGYPTFNPGFVDVYDVSEDCRHPQLRSSTPLGVLGHESGFAPDGNTFYVSSTGGRTLTALDLSDPALPRMLWIGRDWTPHGVRVSADGNRLYVADIAEGLVILDVSEIQARRPSPRVRVVSTLQWEEMSIPQVAIPVTIAGNPYLVQIDEFSRGLSTAAEAPVGAARIIDIADETAPEVVSSLRLEVNNPEHRAASMGDPGTSNPIQGYTGHYCAVPREDDPGVVACTFVASGLRVFDIRDPRRPREIAYFNKPVGTGFVPAGQPSSYAMSAPAFVPERGEIWYLDGNSGFYVLRFTNGVWPFEAAGAGEVALPAAGDQGVRPDAGLPELPATGGRNAPAAIALAASGGAAAALVWMLRLAAARRGRRARA